jgi:hypothetical protein
VREAWAKHAPLLGTILVILLLIISAFYYTHNMANWRGFDDEGGYLYAAWRISLGEMPYRDFLTPQMPLFLYPGALALGLADLSLTAAQWSMTLYTLGALFLTYLTVRRIWGLGPALLAMPLLLLSGDMFWAARFFRPEAPMLFWAALGLYLITVGYPQRRRIPLIGGGVALGLSMMSKLFGALPLAGVGLFLLARGLRTRQWRDMISTGLAIGLPFLFIVGAFTTFFQIATGEFVASVLGHHLRQGRGTPWREVAIEALGLYRGYIGEQTMYVVLAGLGVFWLLWPQSSLDDQESISQLYLWQLPTAIVFFLMTRTLQGRHLTYLSPSMGALGGLGLYGLWRLDARRLRGAPELVHRQPSPGRSLGLSTRHITGTLALAGLLFAALAPHVRQNARVMQWGPCNVDEWIHYIRAHLEPDEYLLSDYPALNFFSRRAAPPIAAGISEGAAGSGQILGAQLIEEIETYDVPMVLLNVAHGAHQFANLQDYPLFKSYVQSHFVLAERRNFDYRLIEIYAREDLWPGEPMSANLGHQLELTGLRWLQHEAAPGEDLQLDLRWRSLAPMPSDYWVSLRLKDAADREWALGGKSLINIDKEVWMDEQGLLHAVPIFTSQWPIGETTIGTYELPVRPGTPPGTYAVYLRVHPEGQWHGLNFLNEDGQPIDYDVPLGTATVLPPVGLPTVDALALNYGLVPDFEPTLLTDELALLGYVLSAGAVRPGDQLVATLCWQAEQSPTQDYGARLRLGDEEAPLAVATLTLGGADYATSRWRAGEALCNQVSLSVDRLAPGGAAVLTLDLLDEDGHGLTTMVLTELPIHGRERVYDAPAHYYPVVAHFGDQPSITLLGFDLPHPPVEYHTEDDTVTLPLTMYWRSDGIMDTSYTLFLHLLDREGHIRGQVDTLPCNGDCSTTSWLPGEVISHTVEISVAIDALPDSAAAALGWYNAVTGVRLPAMDADGHPLPDDRLLLRRPSHRTP